LTDKDKNKGKASASPGATAEERLGAVLFYSFVVGLAYLVFQVFLPFMAPLLWAGVIVVVTYGWHKRLERRLGKNTAAVVSTASVTILIVAPTILVAMAFARQGLGLAHAVQNHIATGGLDWINDKWAALQDRLSSDYINDFDDVIRTHAANLAEFVASKMGVILQHVVRFVVDMFVMILTMFYLYRDGDHVVDRIRRTLPFDDDHSDRMIEESRELIFASVLSTLLTAALHGAVGAIVFRAVGLHEPIFWGVMMAFLSIVPVVGSSLVWGPAAIVLLLRGHIGAGISVIVVCAGVIALVENIIRPWLISGRAHINPLIIFISILGGIGVFGPLGIVLGPVIVASATSVIDLYAYPEPKRHETS
jgi:predicted PurR-regulated permease PerM